MKTHAVRNLLQYESVFRAMISHHVAAADVAQTAAPEAGLKSLSIRGIPRARLPKGHDAPQMIQQSPAPAQQQRTRRYELRKRDNAFIA